MVELVIVVLILGILAGVAAPRFLDATTNANAAAVLANVKLILDAAERYEIEHGALPNDVRRGEFPPELEGYLRESVFLLPSEIGGYYDWDGPGTTRNFYGVVVTITPESMADATEFAATNEVYLEIERLADDGVRSTGWIRANGNAIFFRWIDR